MPTDASVSVIICTRDRAAGLQKTLDTLENSVIPPGWKVELIVVDNGSSDNTREGIQKRRFSRISLQYVFEPKAGLSHARNSGLVRAAGDVILFTDDDVLVDPSWIHELANPIIQERCDAAVGLVVLSPGLQRPWMTVTHKGWLACSREAQLPDWPVSLVGANMGFCRTVLSRVPSFDPELGSGALGSGEDTLFGMQLVEAGYRIEFNRVARVVHEFDSSRLLRHCWLRYAEKRGRTEGYIDYHWRHTKRENLRAELASYWVRLKFRRVLQPPGGLYAEGCPPWEMSYVANIARIRQFRTESHRQRVYDFQALARRDSLREGNMPPLTAHA